MHLNGTNYPQIKKKKRIDRKIKGKKEKKVGRYVYSPLEDPVMESLVLLSEDGRLTWGLPQWVLL